MSIPDVAVARQHEQRFIPDWEVVLVSLNKLTLERIGACEACGGLAHYNGRACGDGRVVKLCARCLRAAVSKLHQMRDDAKLVTGYEPVCNTCWRPLLDPSTHMELQALLA